MPFSRGSGPGRRSVRAEARCDRSRQLRSRTRRSARRAQESPEVEASDVSLTIKVKGEVEHEETREDERYRISETSRGAFVRTVHLPSEVDSAKARATFKDGVVEVTLPKLDRSRPHQLKL
jgi:HSP20 family molecular chaperone IbpA